MIKMAGAGMWKSQGYGKLFELPTTLWIPLRGLHFPTFSSWLKDYLKSKERKKLDTTEPGSVFHHILHFLPVFF